MRDPKNGVAIHFRHIGNNQSGPRIITDYGSEANVRFVKAITETRFAISVDSNGRFKTEGCRSVAIKIEFDGGMASTERIQRADGDQALGRWL
jgi:hypothetical protein